MEEGRGSKGTCQVLAARSPTRTPRWSLMSPAICLEQLGAGRGGSTEGNRTLPEQKPEVKFIKTPACTELFLRTTGSTFEDAL